MSIPKIAAAVDRAAWPTLPADDWGGTLATLHLWTQVVGKVRMASSPWENHSWSVPLYLSASGLTTSLVPYGSEGFEIELDLVRHRLDVRATTGVTGGFELHDGLSVADVYELLMGLLDRFGMPVSIDPLPSEIADAIPFPADHEHDRYEPEHAHALWRALLQARRVLVRFRAGYLGKASPVHFFWGSFDLATTRFSGRPAPPHPGGLPNFPLEVAREAYSHELTSVGFWPGAADAPTPVFYAYAYPAPEGFARARIEPEAAAWSEALGEFILPYEAVRTAPDPDAALTAFAESTHAAAADLAGWDREALECAHPYGPDWWHLRRSA